MSTSNLIILPGRDYIGIDELNLLSGMQKDNGFRVGQKLFIRTITYHITGEITSIDGDFLTLRDAAWIADSGRFADALVSCEFDEVEPLPDGWRVNTAAITDCGPIERLPKEQR